ncbi:MAG TPA: hypothetical protein VMF10_14150 [Candidatus Aquilonibacter sp.]|nr:hypothetical protein [Candidatus Aquilonibacter sp.]
MKSTNAWGWLAAGVLALGLNGIYHDGGSAWAHRVLEPVIGRIAQRTAPVLALASGDAEGFVAETRAAFANNEIASCRWAASLARVESGAAGLQSGFARLQAVSAREEAQFARRQAEMARLEATRARIEARMASIRIPDVKVDVDVPACPRIHVNIPRVSITRCSW